MLSGHTLLTSNVKTDVYSRLWVLICFIVSLLALASQNVLFLFYCNKLITRKAANGNISESLTLPQVCQVSD